MKKVLMLSAYDALSHRYWREQLMTTLFPHFEWTVLTLPPRYFNWRIRGNALTWALGQREVFAQQYDACIATSMVDLATLRGLAPSLARTPTIAYFHENQFAYPANELRESSRVEAQITSIYTALAADHIVFNSQYNRTTFLEGTAALLDKMPDHVPANIVSILAERARVIPVAVAKPALKANKTCAGPLEILWNHRWEYDKAPQRLLAALRLVAGDYRLHITGPQFREVPHAFAQIKEEFGDKILTWGYQAKADYHAVLARAHVVVSTAVHEFQGVAVMEAALAGATPLVPDRLAYQEAFEKEFRYTSDLENVSREASALANALSGLISFAAEHPDDPQLPQSHRVQQYTPTKVCADYAALFD